MVLLQEGLLLPKYFGAGLDIFFNDRSKLRNFIHEGLGDFSPVPDTVVGVRPLVVKIPAVPHQQRLQIVICAHPRMVPSVDFPFVERKKTPSLKIS